MSRRHLPRSSASRPRKLVWRGRPKHACSSAKINEKYQTYTFETEAGKVISGLVLEETKDQVKIIENPLLKAEPIALKKSDIVERQKSATSLMPKGLFDKLTLEEILDLVAFVASRGDSKAPFFAEGHDHGDHD